MKLISREEQHEFAPFDLTKTPKFDKKKDKVELSIQSFELANTYFRAAQILFSNRGFIVYMPVILTNIAFSCELYLKALLHGYNIDFGNTHELKDLFDKLPDSIKEYVAENIAIENREREFPLCLKEQNSAFTTYRYMNEVKSISANPQFLFAFAHVLSFVYSILTEHPDEHSREEDCHHEKNDKIIDI